MTQNYIAVQVTEACAAVHLKIIRDCYFKLMNTGLVVDSGRNDRPSTSRTEENVFGAGYVYPKSQRPTRLAIRERCQSRHTIRTVVYGAALLSGTNGIRL